MNVSWRRIIQGMLICVIAGVPTMALQTPQRSVRDGVYTGPQATRGQTTYRGEVCELSWKLSRRPKRTASCRHGFHATWSKDPLAELANK